MGNIWSQFPDADETELTRSARAPSVWDSFPNVDESELSVASTATRRGFPGSSPTVVPSGMSLIDYFHHTQPDPFGRPTTSGLSLASDLPPVEPPFGLFGRGSDTAPLMGSDKTDSSAGDGSADDGDPYRSHARTVAGAAAGSGFPVLPKPKGGYAMGALLGRTSPASIALRQVEVLRNIKLNPRIPTPTLGSLTAEAPDMGVLLGRGLPAAGLALMGLDVLTSKNRQRALAGNAGATLGGLFGSIAGSEGGPPGMILGSLAGASLGQNIGERAYDGTLFPGESIDQLTSEPLGPGIL